MRHALHKFATFNTQWGIHTKRIGGMSQPALRVNGRDYKYYDGMQFNAAGDLLTPEQPWMAKRINRQESKEFQTELKACGFRNVFKVLKATNNSHHHSLSHCPEYIAPYMYKDIITNIDRSQRWPDVVARVSSWDALMAICKAEMYEEVEL